MRAAVYRSKGPARDVLSLENWPLPTPQPGEVRIRLAFSGVNPSDVKSRSGVSGPAMPFEAVVPHSDGAGVVDALGPGVPDVWLGKRVWVYNAQWGRAHGTACEYVNLPLSQVVELPDAVSLEVGASIGIPLMTAYHAVQACGSLLGQTVLVSGAVGSVGAYATQLAARSGARVIAVVSTEAKAAQARALGAAEAVIYRQPDWVQQVRALTGGRGVDAIIEVDAAGQAPHYGELLAFGGKVVVYGSNQAQIGVPFRPMILSFATLYFFIVYSLPADVLRKTIEGSTALLQQNALRHPEVAVFDLEQIAQAHERVEQGANAKVLIRL
jgi:NADPH:quinone reductase